MFCFHLCLVYALINRFALSIAISELQTFLYSVSALKKHMGILNIEFHEGGMLSILCCTESTDSFTFITFFIAHLYFNGKFHLLPFFLFFGVGEGYH